MKRTYAAMRKSARVIAGRMIPMNHGPIPSVMSAKRGYGKSFHLIETYCSRKLPMKNTG